MIDSFLRRKLLIIKQTHIMDKKVLLMILDGWGEGRQDESNVIYTHGAPYI